MFNSQIILMDKHVINLWTTVNDDTILADERCRNVCRYKRRELKELKIHLTMILLTALLAIFMIVLDLSHHNYILVASGGSTA